MPRADLFSLNKFLNREAGGPNEAAERSPCHFLMIGNGERRSDAFLYENNVIPGASNAPSEFFECANDFSSGHDR